MLQLHEYNLQLENFYARHARHIRDSNTVFPLISAGSQISAAPLGIHIEISASPLKSIAPLNVVLIRIATIFY